MTEDVRDDAPAEPVMDPGTDPSGRGEASPALDPEGVARDGRANADLEPEAATPAEPDRAEPVSPGPDRAEPERAEPVSPEPDRAEPVSPEPETAQAPAPEVDASAETPGPTPTADTPEGPPPSPTVGRAIADALRAAGVRYAFTVPGESFLGILDVLGEAGIRVVATRHESGAAFMAEAHGQLTGRPAIAMGTRAVGSANLAIGIHTARQDSTPMFALVGQVDRADRGREAFQEIDQVTTIGGLAKWAAEPNGPDDVAAVLTRAIREALDGRPGPVLLSLPEDLLDEAMPEGATIETRRTPPPRPAEDDVRAVIESLASARRPVILAGGGVLRARTSTDLLRFAELLQVAVIAGWRRPDVISNDHPLYLGMAGLASPSGVRARLAAADGVLVIGCRLNEPTSDGYRWPTDETRWHHVDIDPRRAAGLPTADRVVVADARAFLKAANERLLGHAVLDAERMAARQEHNRADRAAWEAATVIDATPWAGPGVHPGRVITTLRSVLPDDGIVVTDAGNFASGAGRGFRFRKPGTFLGPTSGARGYGLPAAIAA